MAGLLLLCLVAPWWLASASAAPNLLVIIGIGIMPPLALTVATWKRTRNWSGITALVMIPYAVLGMMDIVASSGAIAASLVLGTLSISVFFLVLDAGRRDG
jgi:hypothetical protein